MKNSHILQKELSFEYHTIMECDLIEIDNVDLHNPIRLNYLDRLRLCLNIIQSKFPDPKDISIGDFACAQGNIGLSLAELGYNVFAVDINPVFINYSKKKYEKGNIQWIVSEISDLTIKPDSLDVVIIGELIEHCAYPEEIIKKILEFVVLAAMYCLQHQMVQIYLIGYQLLRMCKEKVYAKNMKHSNLDLQVEIIYSFLN